MTIRDLTDRQLACRSFGHAWKPETVTPTETASGRIVEYRCGLRCVRCSTQRTQMLDAHGNTQGNRYAYAEGYLQPKGEGRYERQDIRMEFVVRTLERGAGS